MKNQAYFNTLFYVDYSNYFKRLGIPERIDYAPGTGREDLFPDAELELCDVPCTVHSVETKLNLATSHIGKGCDRDTYSVQSQRKLCGKL
jgi:hypothetical protein